MIYVYLANGFEETEAIAPIDLLRRSEKKVITVGVGDNIITSSHGVNIVTDTIAQEAPLTDELEMIVLPGGMPGTLNLEASPYVQAAIDYCVANNIYIGAICAAPSILGHKGDSSTEKKLFAIRDSKLSLTAQKSSMLPLLKTVSSLLQEAPELQLISV